jgi:glycerate kinase
LVFLNTELISGIELVKKLVDFDNKIKNADWIITGEGRLDMQTLSGKTIHGVISSAKKNNIPVAVFCGSILLSKKELDNIGISHAESVLKKAKNLEDAMQNSSHYLKIISAEFVKEF